MILRRSSYMLAFILAFALVVAACTDTGAGTTVTDLPVASLDPAATSTTAAPAPSPPPTVPQPPVLPAGETICDRFAEPVELGELVSADLRETSGIVASRTYPDILWAHNDSGDAAAVHAIGIDGADLGRFRLTGSLAIDWEDIAIGSGPDPERDYLYLADIGDNLLLRSRLPVYRIPEPRPDRTGGIVDDVDVFTLTFGELGSFNAEALLADPVTGDLVVITKRDAEGRSVVFRADGAKLEPGKVTTLEPLTILALGDGAEVTAADITADGGIIALRGYEQVWMWLRTESDIGATFAAEPCSAPSPSERQGEALAFNATGSGYYTVSEGTHSAVNYVGPADR